MVEGDREFMGSLGTQAVKIFDLVAARTGLRDTEAREAGFEPFTDHFEAWDHKAYYPGAERMFIRITGDRRTGRLLGGQILGHLGSEVSKRIDVSCNCAFQRNAGGTVERSGSELYSAAEQSVGPGTDGSPSMDQETSCAHSKVEGFSSFLVQ